MRRRVAICSAICLAAGISSSGSTTLFTRPYESAVAASIGSPSNRSSFARPKPTSRGRRCVPAKPGVTPSFTSGCPIFALDDAIRMSHAIAISSPPPRAKPLTAAMTGFERFSIVEKAICPSFDASLASMPPIFESSLMSAPATNALPAPVRMTTATSSSPSMSCIAWMSSRIVSPFRAFKASGRSIVTVAMSPSFSTVMLLKVISPPPAASASDGVSDPATATLALVGFSELNGRSFHGLRVGLRFLFPAQDAKAPVR